MLRVTLLGNLGGDPELRFTAKGTPSVTFNVAINQVRTGPDGERQENTEWFRIRVTGPKAEYAQRLGKGNKVLVVGRLVIGHYQARSGEQKTSFDVWADELQNVSARPINAEPDAFGESDTEAPEPASAGVSSIAGKRRASNGRTESPSTEATEGVEDLPF